MLAQYLLMEISKDGKALWTVEPADSLASFPSADNRRRRFSNSIYGRIRRCWGAPNSLECNQTASVFCFVFFPRGSEEWHLDQLWFWLLSSKSAAAARIIWKYHLPFLDSFFVVVLPPPSPFTCSALPFGNWETKQVEDVQSRLNLAAFRRCLPEK